MTTLSPINVGDNLDEIIRGLHRSQGDGQSLAIRGVNWPLVLASGVLSCLLPVEVLVRNDSGSNCDITDVLGISGSVVNPNAGAGQQADFQQQITLTGVTPATPDHLGKFVICAEPIAAGTVGKCWAGGVCPAYINVGATTDKFADITNGDATQLTSGTSGAAQILYPPTGTGQQWCVVRLGVPAGFKLYWGRLNATTAPGTPPDERYYLDEVQPAGVDSGGAIDWEVVPNGLTNVVAWNTAEAGNRTHQLPVGLVVLVREELDESSPPVFRSIFCVYPGGGGSDSCLVRVTGYDGTAYTVQPVAWSGGAWTDTGAPISGVPNIGEIQAGEQGYLSGPSGANVYVRMYTDGGEQYLAVHPPRMP